MSMTAPRPCEPGATANPCHEKEIMMSVINDSRHEGSILPSFGHAGTSELADQSTGDRVQLSSLRRGLLLYALYVPDTPPIFRMIFFARCAAAATIAWACGLQRLSNRFSVALRWRATGIPAMIPSTLLG